MKYRFPSLLLLLFPVIAHAMPFSGPIPGIIEFIALVFVIIPILSIESLAIIYLAVTGKFNNQASVTTSNKIVGLTVIAGCIALLGFIYANQAIGEGTIFLILGLAGSSATAITLPNVLRLYYKKHNKSLNQTGAKNAPPG